MTELSNLSWLCIGFGIGLLIGQNNYYIWYFGIAILTIGFILNYFDDRNSKKIQ